MTGGPNSDGSVAEGDAEDREADAWPAAERELLDAALAFYDAADGVVDYAGRERPQVRHDAAGFEALRCAMRTLEERVRAASAADVAPARIAEIARIDAEMVELILRRDPAAAPDPSGG